MTTPSAEDQLAEIQRRLDAWVPRDDLTLVERVQEAIDSVSFWSDRALRNLHEIHGSKARSATCAPTSTSSATWKVARNCRTGRASTAVVVSGVFSDPRLRGEENTHVETWHQARPRHAGVVFVRFGGNGWDCLGGSAGW